MTYSLEITRPLFLLSLLLVVIIVLAHRRSLVDFALRQRRLSLFVRTLIAVALILAAAGLNVLYPTAEKYIVVLNDHSTSVGEPADDGWLQQLAEQAGERKLKVIDFSSDSALPRGLTENRAAFTDEDRQGTDIARAIRVARASIPPFYVPEIVLRSDGNETRGDALQAATAAGVPVHTVPLRSRRDAEVQVSSVKVPAQVQRGARFEFEALIDASAAGPATVNVFVGQHKQQSAVRELKKGENRIVFQMDANFDQQEEISVSVESKQDTLLDNNQASGVVFTSGAQRVLVISSDRKARLNLVNALKQHKLQVTDHGPEFFPESLSELQKYEAVILSNVSANQLSVAKMQNVRTYVEELGGGLIMLGGDQSFGLGGYYKTALENVLPVRSDFEKEKEKPSLAMVLIIDKSGSMGGTKLEMAKDAAKGAVELLGPRDQVGVVAFDGSSQWASEVHAAADKGYILKRISTIRPGGGTSMHPAMKDALQALTNSVAKLKHVILLSDGHSTPGDFEGVATQMATARITVSTVAVGEKADRQLLKTISQIGNGRYYACDNPESIPQIFAKETVTASKSAINEEPFLPKLVQRTSVLSNLDLDAAPMLMGYVATKAKRTSQQILVTETGEPLLCWWRYGLGMSVAFTSDASSRWADEWLNSDEFYSNFWAQVTRHAMRKVETRGLFVDVQRRGEQAEITVDSVDKNGTFRNDLRSTLTILHSSGGDAAGPMDRRDLQMKQIAPGKYRASIDQTRRGTYQLLVTQKDADGKIVSRQSRGLIVGYPDELRLRPTNEQLLKDIATATGGQFDPGVDEVLRPTDRRVARVFPLWRHLLIAALVLLVLDVALRRIDFWPILRSESV